MWIKGSVVFGLISTLGGWEFESLIHFFLYLHLKSDVSKAWVCTGSQGCKITFLCLAFVNKELQTHTHTHTWGEGLETSNPHLRIFPQAPLLWFEHLESDCCIIPNFLFSSNRLNLVVERLWRKSFIRKITSEAWEWLPSPAASLRLDNGWFTPSTFCSFHVLANYFQSHFQLHLSSLPPRGKVKREEWIPRTAYWLD